MIPSLLWLWSRGSVGPRVDAVSQLVWQKTVETWDRENLQCHTEWGKVLLRRKPVLFRSVQLPGRLHRLARAFRLKCGALSFSKLWPWRNLTSTTYLWIKIKICKFCIFDICYEYGVLYYISEFLSSANGQLLHIKSFACEKWQWKSSCHAVAPISNFC